MVLLERSYEHKHALNELPGVLEVFKLNELQELRQRTGRDLRAVRLSSLRCVRSWGSPVISVNATDFFTPPHTFIIVEMRAGVGMPAGTLLRERSKDSPLGPNLSQLELGPRYTFPRGLSYKSTHCISGLAHLCVGEELYPGLRVSLSDAPEGSVCLSRSPGVKIPPELSVTAGSGEDYEVTAQLPGEIKTYSERMRGFVTATTGNIVHPTVTIHANVGGNVAALTSLRATVDKLEHLNNDLETANTRLGSTVQSLHEKLSVAQDKDIAMQHLVTILKQEDEARILEVGELKRTLTKVEMELELKK